MANVKFPSVYQRFLDSVNFFNFDLSWVLSAGCLLEVDFHDRLLWTTISPLVIMGLLGITYTTAMHRNLTSPETTIRHIQHKHVSMVPVVIILVYSSVSSVVFQMFACDDLDDGKRYLRADYTIDCDSSKHRVLQIYSGFMILLYPVGIPALYASLLFWNSTSSAGSLTLQETPLIRSISSLWKPYKPQRFYYEVIECARRVSLTGVIVFIYPNSAAQVAATFAIAVWFIFVSEGMAPYASPWDAWISSMGQAIIFATMFLALLLKVNVSGENDASQKMFEAILVACHGCMVLAVVIQIMIMVLSLRVVRQREDPRPRLRRPANLALAIQPCVIEDDDTSKEEL